MLRNFFFIIILSSFIASAPSIGRAAEPANDGPILPGAGMEGWWEDASRVLEAMEYEISPVNGLLQAPNREQNLRTIFREAGVEITPRTQTLASEGWRFGWVTESWGRAGSLLPIASVPPVSDRERAEFRYGKGFTEWYVNRPEGLEQGFTIVERPAGSGAVVIAGHIDVDLEPRLSADRRQVDFLDTQGDCHFRYGGLYVEDANGTRLPSRLELHGETIRIVFDDLDATYPVTVDPLMTSPSWQTEGNQEDANHGYQVATAGDVNGDGFSDVIVGAFKYDAGWTDEGRAFIYFGSEDGLNPWGDWHTDGNHAGVGHGFSVATAGDINGDGYDDVLVGVPFFDGDDGTNGGAVRLYYGSVSGPSTWPDWFVGTGSSDINWQIGRSVATAGDVNGDGYDDIIYGAFYYSGGQSLEGAAWVRYGSADGILDSPIWQVEGNQDNATLGRSVATAGDVNGDGYADVIIGADGYDLSFTNNGRASVYLGSASGVQSSPVWEYYGNEHNANFGYSVATAGDVNGDGYSDIIVGSPNESDDIGTPDEGLAFVFYGTAGGPYAFPGWIGEGDQDESRYGWSVGTAGDINGDGFADAIVGAWQWDGGQASEGKAFVYLGSSSGLSWAPEWSTESNQAGARLGWSVATAGDVNGDGFSDVIVGAWYYDNGQSNEGGAWVYRGSASGIHDTPAWTQYGQNTGHHYSSAVAYAGDVNGDGFSDVLIGADNYSDVEPWLGRIYINRGTDAGPLDTPAWIVDGEDPLSGFGSYLSTAGDVNGDGYSDVALTAYSFNGPLGDDQGKAYVYCGSPSWPSSTPDWTFLGEQGTARLGTSVATAGDVNGDGYSDLIIGSYRYHGSAPYTGKAYVFHGSPGGLSASPNWTVEGGFEGALLGAGVSTAGDVNGDGFSDVIVGLPSTGVPGGAPGSAHVYLGSETGLETTPVWTGSLGGINDWYGYWVSTAGDVNADGYDDIIVSAVSYDPVGYPEDTGAVAVYLGSSTGPEAGPHWFVWSDQGGASMGLAISTAGDINGDGYSDIIFSAARYDYPLNDEGVVWVKLGSADGLVGFPEWAQLGGMANAWYGNVLSTAGDMNGDGYDDVIIGAEGYEYDGLIGAGRATVHLGNARLPDDPGLPLLPGQGKTDGSPIELLCRSDSEDEFRVRVNGRSAAGRCRVRLAGNVAEVGQAIEDGMAGHTTWFETGTPVAGEGSVIEIDEPVENLTAGMSYHWRLRVESNSPFFPHTPWLSMPTSVPSQKQLRLGGGASGIADDATDESASLKLLTVRPNPFTPRTAIVYALPTDGQVELSIYDPSGRKVRTLVDGEQTAGRQVVRWDGRDGNGDRAASGIYFARLESGQEERTVKLVLRR